MIPKQYLGQARHLDMQINAKLEQITLLRDMAEKVTTTFSHAPKSHNGSNRLEYCIAKICDLLAEVDHDIDELIDLKAEIREHISQVENYKHRLVLEYRYLCNYSWDRIAQTMHYDVRHVTRLHGEALVAICPVLSRKKKL